MTKDYIESQEYINDMLNGITVSQEDYLKFHYDAEPRTANYTHRHNVIRKKLGTWRWKGVFQFKDILSPIIFSKDLRGIDFGGSQRPISYDVDIVDVENTDDLGRPVKYNSMDDLDFKPDFIFSSHTLEHLDDLDFYLKKFHEKLKPNGHFITLIPSYSCKRWHANTGNWMGNEATKGTPGALAALHKHTFVLNKTNWEFMGLNSPVEIDTKLKEYFNLKIIEYTGDNSIFILGTKKN